MLEFCVPVWQTRYSPKMDWKSAKGPVCVRGMVRGRLRSRQAQVVMSFCFVAQNLTPSGWRVVRTNTFFTSSGPKVEVAHR